jgi:hypothetical protein
MNNYDNGYCCVQFVFYKETCEESNIVNNSQGTGDQGTLNSYNSPTIVIINKCCLIKNNNKGSGKYLFYVESSGSKMEVRECTIQSGYSIKGAVTTTYSNKEINLEKGTEGLKFCAGNVIIYNQLKCRCSIYDNMLINNLYRLNLNKPFLL